MKLGRSVLQKLDDTFTETRSLTPGPGLGPIHITSIVVGIAAAQSREPIEYPELVRLPIHDRVARVGWIPLRPAVILLKHGDVGRRPVFAAVADRRVGGVAQVPFTFPDHLVARFVPEQRGDIRLAVLMHQAGP